VKFKLWSAAAGGTQLGSDYTVPMGSLIVAKRYTEKYDSVNRRKAVRIGAVIGSDGSPVLLPADGQAWLEVMVGTTTLGCDFAATGSAIARRRLQSVPFARESSHSETCDTCTPTSDISARVYKSSHTSLAHNTTVALSFDSERWDTDEIHAPGSSQLTAQTAGKYLIYANVKFGQSSTGTREVGLRVTTTSGNQGIAEERATGNVVESGVEGNVMSLATHYFLNVGDYVELLVTQTSGGPLNVLSESATDAVSPEFGMVKLP
jgi:hypothetical protein